MQSLVGIAGWITLAATTRTKHLDVTQENGEGYANANNADK